eukprot:gene2469-2809_t
MQFDYKPYKKKKLQQIEKQLHKEFKRPDLERMAKEEAELPGVKKEDVDIKITQGVLTVTGEKRRYTVQSTVSNSQGESVPATVTAKLNSSETTYGKFTKEFKLPQLVDLQSISATHVDGVLTITIPKVAPEVIKSQ